MTTTMISDAMTCASVICAQRVTVKAVEGLANSEHSAWSGTRPPAQSPKNLHATPTSSHVQCLGGVSGESAASRGLPDDRA
eukprot:5936797-Pyramimonas_sp.AAC.1